MDSSTQELIDQLRDKMAGMTNNELLEAVMAVMDEYIDPESLCEQARDTEE